MGAMAGSVASGAWTALGVWALASAVAALVVAVRRVAGDTGVANALREASIRVEFEGTLLPTVWPRRSIVELRNRGGTVWVHHVSLAGLAVHDHEGHHVHVGSPAPGEECLPNQPLPFPSHRGSSFYCMWPGKDVSSYGALTLIWLDVRYSFAPNGPERTRQISAGVGAGSWGEVTG